MVLRRELHEDDQKKHRKLIQEYTMHRFGKAPFEVSLIGAGEQKGVYKIDYGEGTFVASAAARDPKQSLLEEYNILTELYVGAREFFPKPIAHFSAEEDLGELLIMEFLPHRDLDHITHIGVTDYYKKLSRKIGRAIALTNIKTGRYSSEPHDGNILGIVNGDDVAIKFCDAIQFHKGGIASAVDSILCDRNMRPECFRFIKHFREGLVDGITEAGQLSRDEANKQLEFLRNYNDIF